MPKQKTTVPGWETIPVIASSEIQSYSFLLRGLDKRKDVGTKGNKPGISFILYVSESLLSNLALQNHPIS